MRSKKTMSWTVISIVALLAAGSAHAGISMTNSLQDYTDTSTNALTIADLASDGLRIADTNAASRAITFDVTGATFPVLGGQTDANVFSNFSHYRHYDRPRLR